MVPEMNRWRKSGVVKKEETNWREQKLDGRLNKNDGEIKQSNKEKKSYIKYSKTKQGEIQLLLE